MLLPFNQRTLRIVCLGLLFGFVAVFPQIIYAGNPAKCVIDKRFGVKETQILRQACALAAERLQNPSIRQELYRRPNLYSLSGSVIKRSNVSDTEQWRKYLLNNQLKVLSLPNGSDDTEPSFPNIYINYGSEKPESGEKGWLGRAPLNTVIIYWVGTMRQWKQKGSFNITINDHFVARGQRYSDPDGWAGTIAHEMLHNLGHNHSSNSNYSKYQINVLDELIQNYGSSYKGERRTLSSFHDCN